MPKSRPSVISACMAAFMLYFFVLREENDIDERFGLNMAESVRRQNELILGSNLGVK